MVIDYAFFCDAATSDSSGKLNVLGIFEKITFVQFPAVLQRMSFVFSFKSSHSDIGFDHVAQIQLIETTSNTAILSQNFTVSGEGTVNIIINLENINFEVVGLYNMNVHIDGQLLKSTPLNVVVLEKESTYMPH